VLLLAASRDYRALRPKICTFKAGYMLQIAGLTFFFTSTIAQQLLLLQAPWNWSHC